MTGLTTWERWYAGLPARTDEERARYREYDAAAPARDLTGATG